MQQPELGVDGHHKIRGCGGRGLKNLLSLLFFQIVDHGLAVVDHHAAEFLHPAAVLQSTTGQSNPLWPLPAGENGQVHAERLAGAHTAPEHRSYPVLACLAVKQRLFRRQFAAGFELQQAIHALGPADFVAGHVQFPETKAGILLRQSLNPAIHGIAVPEGNRGGSGLV